MKRFDSAAQAAGAGVLLLATALFSIEPAAGQQAASRALQLRQSVPAAEPVTSWSVRPTPSGDIDYIATGRTHILLRANGRTRQIALPATTVMTVASNQGNYFAVASRAASEAASGAELLIEVYARTGRKLGELRRPLPYDDALPQILLSETDGAAILGHAPDGTISWFAAGGAPQARVRLFPDADYDFERTLHMTLSADGSRLAVVASRRGVTSAGGVGAASAEPHLFYFDGSGHELWRKPLSGNAVLTAAAAPNGTCILAGSYTTDASGAVRKFTQIFDDKGELVATAGILFKHAAFSIDSRQVVLAENNRVAAFSLPSGKLLWERNIPRSEGLIAAVGLLGNEGLTALLLGQSRYQDGDFIFTNPVLEILGASGVTLRQNSFAGKTFTRPALVLTKNQGGILLGFSDALNVYEMR